MRKPLIAAALVASLVVAPAFPAADATKDQNEKKPATKPPATATSAPKPTDKGAQGGIILQNQGSTPAKSKQSAPGSDKAIILQNKGNTTASDKAIILQKPADKQAPATQAPATKAKAAGG